MYITSISTNVCHAPHLMFEYVRLNDLHVHVHVVIFITNMYYSCTCTHILCMNICSKLCTSSAIQPLQANDYCQSGLPLGIVQNARALFSQHDIAWRDWDKAKFATITVLKTHDT